MVNALLDVELDGFSKAMAETQSNNAWEFEMKTKMIIVIAGLLALPEFASAQFLPPPPAIGSNSASASSWLAGAQAGYNWQSGSVVYGLEADIAGTGLKSTMNTTLQSFFVPPPTAITTSSI
jgi:hypothetical protein